MADRVTKVTLNAVVSQYVSEMEKAARKTTEVGSAAEKLAQKGKAIESLGKTALVAGTAITALGLAALKTGVDYNSLQQTSRAALTTLLGSASAAADQMDRLDEFARTSPFSKATFIKAQQQMLAFGIEAKKVVPYLDAIQNAVAAAGGSNADIEGIVATMSKIQSSAKLTAEDLNEFGNRGVNAAGLIGEQMGKTGAQIREEITAGSLDATAALDALVAGMSERFDGAADNVKQTFEGAVDRVKAAWRDFSSELAKPLVDPNGGGALVDFLNWTADAVRNFQALPEPVKAFTTALVLSTGATLTLGGAALLALPKIVALKTTLASLGVSGGSIARMLGGATGALVVLSAAYAVYAERQASAAATTAELQGTLDATTGAITDNTRALVAKKLAEAGAFEVAKDLGISQRELTDAILEGGDAFDELRGKFSAKNNVIDFFNGSGIAAGNAGVAIDELSEALPKAAERLEDEAKAAHSSAESTESAADAYLNAADQASELQSNLQSLIDTVNEANGVGQDAVSANANYQKALEGVNETIAQAQQGVEGYTTSVDESTAAGAENAAMFADLAGKSQDAALAQFKLDGDTQKYIGTLETGRQSLYDTILALTGNADAAQALTDKIYAMPSQKEIDIIADTAAAQTSLDQFIASNSNRRIGVAIDGIAGYTGAGGITNANGGMHDYTQAFANGGFGSGFYKGRPGSLYKFAEPETRWEAFISGKPGQEERNRGIALDAYERLGGKFPQVASESAASGPGLTMTNQLLREIRDMRQMIEVPASPIQSALGSSNVGNTVRGA